MSAPVHAALVLVTLVAFAANSLLNRAALVDGAIGPASFALIRVAAGAATLLALVVFRTGVPRPRLRNVPAAAGLTLYMLGFSFAYLSLDAGFGALLLFAAVQTAMFAGALLLREPVPPRRWFGAVIALAGLVLLVRPDPGVDSAPFAAALMVLAAIGWAGFSLAGRASAAPLNDTALAFLLCLPVTVLAWWLIPDVASPTSYGITLAVISGAVTSGCGYALWYLVLPGLGPSRAAVAQLSVPVIAALGGVVLLGEALSLTMVIAGALVLGGVAVSLGSGQTRR
ncbi:MAG: DMT family transporter [Dinoroseobacter sp.]|nr:DMT family transporter [Dinoroseobacter sp.]